MSHRQTTCPRCGTERLQRGAAGVVAHPSGQLGHMVCCQHSVIDAEDAGVNALLIGVRTADQRCPVSGLQRPACEASAVTW